MLTNTDLVKILIIVSQAFSTYLLASNASGKTMFKHIVLSVITILIWCFLP